MNYQEIAAASMGDLRHAAMQLQLVAQSQSTMSSLTKLRATATTATAAGKSKDTGRKAVSTSVSSTGTAGGSGKSSGFGVAGDDYDEEMGVDDTGHPHHRHYRRRDGVYSSLAGGSAYPPLP